jgi:GT2 family glycosyltransferase
MSSDSSVTIVVPIYADWPSLSSCINSLKKFVASNNTILLINDCGPEADLLEKKIIEETKENDKFHYYRNPRNLGFVQTCNRAVVELDKTDNYILLLNSDTVATNGFLEEMLSVMQTDKKVATVSPRTNNATICTFPIIAMNQKGIEPNKSYKLFLKYKDKLPAYNVAPTAHGFCMLVRRRAIKNSKFFDEVFGKGYGEEVDLCQRLAKAGWLNTISNRSFVFHIEAASFSLEAKKALLEKSGAIIRERYPGYKQSVTDYIEMALEQEGKVINDQSYRLRNFIRSHKKLHKLARTLNKRVKI